ncbi:MAG: Gfo/Idh/MocA family oxidoreductase [Alphaproteobacteria bacterium]|nr:Gfo/Idh/MocA family oxidoreductase [Alphaproteobacteria bacterium]
MINVGVVGCGYWGPNLIRNFLESDATRTTMICDLDPERLAPMTRRYPAVRATTSYAEMLADTEVDAVAIATPVRTHFDLAMAALKAGKHVLIEKPMTETVAQARLLIEEAERRRLTLMVDHTFVYTGAVRRIRALVDSGDVGDVRYFDSIRVNLGLFQHDVDVIWDLAVHDLSILDYVLRQTPVEVSAVGANHIPGMPENIAYLTLFYDSGVIAHVNVNWLAPVKVRRTLIGGTRKMIIFDDLETSEKVKIYDSGITVTQDPEQIYQMLIGYRTGDMYAPKIDGKEALRVEVAHFADCVATGRRSETDGVAGLRLVSMLTAATESMKSRGRPVALSFEGVAP